MIDIGLPPDLVASCTAGCRAGRFAFGHDYWPKGLSANPVLSMTIPGELAALQMLQTGAKLGQEPIVAASFEQNACGCPRHGCFYQQRETCRHS
jgi:hypothetical protein